MNEIERLISTEELKTNLLVQFAETKPHLFFYYDDLVDELLLSLVSPEKETVVHYIDDHVALLYESDTLEVVGLQVEDFESSFVPRYSAVEKVWRLSDCVELGEGNVWDLNLAVQKMQPIVAREVVKASETLLGEKAVEFSRVFA